MILQIFSPIIFTIFLFAFIFVIAIFCKFSIHFVVQFSEDKLTAAEITDTVLHGLSHLCEATNKFSISQNDIKKLIGETDANSHWIIPSVPSGFNVVHIYAYLFAFKLNII